MTKLTTKRLLTLTLSWLIACGLQKIAPVNQRGIITEGVEDSVAEQLGIEKRDLASYGIVDSSGKYGAAIARKLEEVFLVVWDMETGEIIYTTRGKNRYPKAYTWVGEKLVYIAYDGVSYTYQLDYMINHRITTKLFCFDLATRKDLVLNLQVNFYPEIVYSCGSELILFEILGLPPDYTSRMIWYNIAQDKRIQEWAVDVGKYFGMQGLDASLVYCTPDHKRAWIVTFLDGPRLTYTGYAVPVPVLGVIEQGKVRFLINAEKEWLYRLYLYGSPINYYLIRVIRTNQEEVVATVTFNRISNSFHLVHFSSKGEIYRKKLNRSQLIAKGVKEFNFLYIDKTGKRLLCQELYGEKSIFLVECRKRSNRNDYQRS